MTIEQSCLVTLPLDVGIDMVFSFCYYGHMSCAKKNYFPMANVLIYLIESTF